MVVEDSSPRVDVFKLIAPSFRRASKDVISGFDTDPKSRTFGMKLREYWFSGGRGSTKSSFISLHIVLHLVRNPKSNCVVFVRVAENIRDSVYKQILWAIDHLELNDLFHCTTSPFRCVYKPTGQEILFRGLDKAGKIKGIKPSVGYFDQIWFEELTEFAGMSDVRSVVQSVLRGGDDDDDVGENVPTWEFYSYNPPQSVSNWVNSEARVQTPGRKVYKSNYLTVPPKWLRRDFFERAEILKKTNPRAYLHEYLGYVTGTGGNVFNNLEIREIADWEIEERFNNRMFGIDWGFAHKFSWTAMHFDPEALDLYIFDEVVAKGMRKQMVAERVRKHMSRVGGLAHILADHASPDSIADFNAWGIPVDPCPKPHGDTWSGRDFEIEALASLHKIIIDPVYAPQHAKEFQEYEFLKNAAGEFTEQYPKINDDCIDSTRYGCFYALRQCGLLNC